MPPSNQFDKLSQAGRTKVGDSSGRSSGPRVFVLGIGAMLKRYVKTSVDFFPAGLAIPFWVCGLTFISAERRKRAIRQTLRYRK